MRQVHRVTVRAAKRRSVWRLIGMLACAALVGAAAGSCTGASAARRELAVPSAVFTPADHDALAWSTLEARMWWETFTGVTPPDIPVELGTPPSGYAGFCYTDKLVVSAPETRIIAHEMGHSLGMQHVEGDELMNETASVMVFGPGMVEQLRVLQATGAFGVTMCKREAPQ